MEDGGSRYSVHVHLQNGVLNEKGGVKTVFSLCRPVGGDMSMKDLTLPVVVAGDLNTTCMQSETLSRIESLGFVRISSDASTTMNKVGCAKKRGSD